MQLTLTTLHLDDGHAANTTVHTDDGRTFDYLANYATRNWADLPGCDGGDCATPDCPGIAPTPAGLDRDRLVALYFTHAKGERYRLDHDHVLDLEPAALAPTEIEALRAAVGRFRKVMEHSDVRDAAHDAADTMAERVDALFAALGIPRRRR